MKLLKIMADSATEAPRSLVCGFLRVGQKLFLSEKSLTQAIVSRFTAKHNLHNTAQNIAGKSGIIHTCYFLHSEVYLYTTEGQSPPKIKKHGEKQA